MVNYSNGKIYKIQPICEHEEGEIYIGSTTKKYLSQRMDKHRSDYQRWVRGVASYITSHELFEKYGFKNCQIVLLENVAAKNKDELRAREGYYVRTLKCLNKMIPGRTKAEYSKEYRQSNREKIKEREKEYRKNNQEKIKECSKQYWEKNREKIKEYRIEYRKLCKNCDICNCDVTLVNFSRHLKSKKHQNNLKLISDKPILTTMKAVNYIPNHET